MPTIKGYRRMKKDDQERLTFKDSKEALNRHIIKSQLAKIVDLASIDLDKGQLSRLQEDLEGLLDDSDENTNSNHGFRKNQSRNSLKPSRKATIDAKMRGKIAGIDNAEAMAEKACSQENIDDMAQSIGRKNAELEAQESAEYWRGKGEERLGDLVELLDNREVISTKSDQYAMSEEDIQAIKEFAQEKLEEAREIAEEDD